MKGNVSVYSLIITNNFWDETKILREESDVIKIVSTVKDNSMQKVDKGDSVVVLNRKSWNKPLNENLSDTSKLEILI